MPLTIRGRPAGVLNAYLAPGQVVGNQTLEFLTAMAEQAAVALDHADLLQAERELARREERQRLARDLHDSIVQQAFSIGMQAKVLGVVAARGDVPTDRVRSIAQEIGVLSQTVLADLRAMVHELRPLSSTSLGLQEALRALAESTTNRTGMRVGLQVGAGADGLGDEVAEDVYRIVAEALHNVVKHAEAGRVTVRVAVRGPSLAITVTDDGHGLPPQRPREGYGLTSMRERAEKWGGTLTVGPRARGGAGTSVRAVVPLPAPHRAQGGRHDRSQEETTEGWCGCSSSTTTRSSDAASGPTWRCSTTSRSPRRPATAWRRWPGWTRCRCTASCPTSCWSTCSCRRWTASRPPRGSGRSTRSCGPWC